jgi:hypothetical protein
MSLRLQGMIFDFPLSSYAKSKKIKVSERSISQLKLLWLSLANFKNEKTGQCNPSIERLSRCIEKSSSQTTEYMNKLKELGLVVVSRNEKGGRYTPQYELPMPCYPADQGVNPPADDTPEFSSETTPLVETFEASDVHGPTRPICRTRILIEPLDESLIKSLVNERNALLKTQGLSNIGKKYGFPFMGNTPIHEVETWLLKAIKDSTAHGISYGNH